MLLPVTHHRVKQLLGDAPLLKGKMPTNDQDIIQLIYLVILSIPNAWF
ncbi:MAG: hypothetical protein F6K50_52005 [Moorea sp. SIO3I7]|nr:hypothetical protein [Moorena sp. SIO3I7]NEO48129.1 hypothetical protein [Moorena sp. SIO4A3]